MNRFSTHPSSSRPGFTLVEATIGALLVGIVLAGALSAVGASARMRLSSLQRDYGGMLADDLAQEIAQKSYGAATGGAIGTVSTSGSRAALTTVDQYNGLDEQPPVTSAGGKISGATGWRRITSVYRVVAASPSTATTAETGVKAVKITVYRGSTPTFEMSLLKTQTWDLSRN